MGGKMGSNRYPSESRAVGVPGWLEHKIKLRRILLISPHRRKLASGMAGAAIQ
jgi:hypothetical protein